MGLFFHNNSSCPSSSLLVWSILIAVHHREPFFWCINWCSVILVHICKTHFSLSSYNFQTIRGLDYGWNTRCIKMSFHVLTSVGSICGHLTIPAEHLMTGMAYMLIPWGLFFSLSWLLASQYLSYYLEGCGYSWLLYILVPTGPLVHVLFYL